ncbi:cysteine--tRNA ligase [Coprothermobacter platensis]|uniref:cysteine--tRNA ligase n=1 Tax=Coprothermobacter platensis TaxID=108819 RepID=UPI00037B25EE|nr:cysteine--tRNA ligase [Coprothermobacter platensis]
MRLYDTESRRLIELDKKPGDSVVGYVCGITPYDEPHLGHVRTALVFDLFQRFLQSMGYKPVFISNFTDVDDKIIERSKALSVHPLALAETYERAYYRLMDYLNVKPLYIYGRVSQVMPDIIDAVEKLIQRDYAYVTPDGVYFSVGKFPDYGILSGRNAEDISQMEARIEPSPYKQDSRDFAIWKARKPSDNIWWDSPWGDGRPGWHIECSVISIKFGTYPLDFHGGGADLIFPHHENERAQSEALMGEKPFAKIWMHTGMLRIGQEEMHKSLGNFIGAQEIMEQYDPDVLRYLLLSTYYRDAVTFSAESYAQADATVKNIRAYKERLNWITTEGEIRDFVVNVLEEVKKDFTSYLEEDLNTAGALSCVHRVMSQLSTDQVNRKEASLIRDFLAFSMEDIFGLRLLPESQFDDSLVQDLVDLRNELRKEKKFLEADSVRNLLSKHGITIEDTKNGTRWIKE